MMPDDRELFDARLHTRIAAARDVLAAAPPIRRRKIGAATSSPSRLTVAAALACAVVLAGTSAAAYHVLRSGPPPAVSVHTGLPPAAARSLLPSTVQNGMQNRAAGGAGGQLPSPGSIGPGQAGGSLGPSCQAGHNGGATAAGVTSQVITLASTAPTTGPMAAMLGEARFGMEAVVNGVNRSGGICGRRVVLDIADDGGSAQKGESEIQGFIDSGEVFALVGMPSSAGLAAAYQAGDIERAGMPVLGNDGVYWPYTTSDLVWPVSATPITAMRIAAHDAATRHAHTFAVVYDASSEITAAAAAAFKAQVAREGGELDSACVVALQPGAGSDAAQAAAFDNQCGNGRSGGGVDFVALDITNPVVWQQWLQAEAPSPYLGIRFDGAGAGAAAIGPALDPQWLDRCGAPCAKVRVWTSLDPDDAPFESMPAMHAYEQDLQEICSSCDPHNLDTEMAYAGTMMALHAIEQVGPVLTRQALRQAMAGLAYDGAILQPMRFSGSNQAGADSMIALIDTTAGTSGAPADFQTVAGPVTDPCPGCSDPRSP